MKYGVPYITLYLIIQFYSNVGYSQKSYIDSLKNELQIHQPDTNKVDLLIKLSYAYAFSYADTGLLYAKQALTLAEKLKFDEWTFSAMFTLNSSLVTIGNYPLLLDYCLKALSLAKKINQPAQIAMANGMLGECYYNLGEYNTSLHYDREVIKIMDLHFKDKVYFMWIQLSRSFAGLHVNDSAILYARKAYEEIRKNPSETDISLISPILGNAFTGKKMYDSALFYYKMGIPVALKNNFGTDLTDSYNGIAAIYKERTNLDSALWYSKTILVEKIAKSYPLGMLRAVNNLSEIYELKGLPDSTLKYMRIAIGLKDSLFNREKMNAVQNMIYKDQEQQKEIENLSRTLQDRLKSYALFAGIFISIIGAFMFFRNQRLRQLQNMRTSIADDLHDDIGATLTNISILSELSKRELDAGNRAYVFLSRISEEISTTSQALDDIIWMVNVHNESVAEIMLRMRKYAGELFDKDGQKYDLTFEEKVPDIKLSMGQRRDLYLIFKEALNNIYKHANSSLVTIKLTKERHLIVMQIKDNGKGFKIQPTHRNGLKSMQNRAKKNKGELKIESTQPGGTTITLYFPY